MISDRRTQLNSSIRSLGEIKAKAQARRKREDASEGTEGLCKCSRRYLPCCPFDSGYYLVWASDPFLPFPLSGRFCLSLCLFWVFHRSSQITTGCSS